jgi:hypothetical protein
MNVRHPMAASMRLAIAVATLAVIALFFAPVSAFAQTGAAPSIERRLTAPSGPPRLDVPAEERILTGRDDLVILRRREFFTLSATTSPRYSSNAFLSDARGDGDVAIEGAANARVETVIAERYTVSADLGYAVARYDRFGELDYDSLSAGIAGRIPDGPWNFSLGYRVAVTKSRGFEDHIVTQHVLNGAVSYAIEIDRNTAIFPFVSLTRIVAHPSDFDNLNLAPGASAVHRIARDLTIGADVQLVARRYDNFFEAFTGRTRQEIGFQSGLGLRWTPHPNVVAQARLGVGYLASTIRSIDYLEFSATPTLTLQIRF